MATSATSVAGKSGRYPEVIEAAARVFSRRGFDSATIQDIADELGMLKGSLYYYITSKDDLLFEVIEQPHRQAMELVHRCRDMEGTVRDRLAALIRGHVEMLTANHIRWRVFLNDFGSLSELHQETLREERRSFEQFLLELLEKGRADGSFRQDLNPSLTARALLGMVNWTAQWYRPETGHDSVDDIAAAYIQLATQGVMRRSESPT